MAYILNVTQTDTANAATYTVTLGSHATNDLLLIYLSQDGGGTTITAPAGWTMLGTQAQSGACRGAWAYKVATSGSETNPQFSGATDDWIGTCIVVRDADATNPFGASPASGTDYVRTDWNNVSSSASGSLTTAVDGCLLLYSWTADGNMQYMRTGFADANEVDKYPTTVINHIIAFRQQQSAGASPTVTMYNINATEGGNGWVLAIRNKTNGALQPDLRITGSDLKFYGAWSATHDSITWQSPDNFTASINSITCGTTVPTILTGSLWGDEAYGQYTGISTANSTAGEWSGGTYSHASTDMTGKLFSVQLAMQSNSGSTVQGSEGIIIGFSDGTNWVAYQIATKTKGWNAGTVERYVIALGQSTAYASSGSINWAAVTRRAYLYHRAGSNATASGPQIKLATLVSSMALTGGGSAYPAKLQHVEQLVNSFGQYRHALLQGSAQIVSKYPLAIGDGTNTTYFDGAAQSFEFPQGWSNISERNWQMFWNVLANQVSLTVKASASDTIKLAAGVAATDTLQALTIDAASSGSATYDFGQSFVGWNPTWNANVPCANATFSSCDPLNTKGANFTNVIVKNTLANSSGDAAVVVDTSGSTLDSCNISCVQDASLGGNSSYHLELGTSVTAITLADVTFTGTPGTDKVHVLKTTGTVTITISGTTTLAAGDVTSAGATVVISAPVLYQTVTISNATAGSRIQIYDTTSSTELYNGTPTFPYTWTDSVAASATRAIRLRCTYVSGTSAKQFIEANIGTCGITSGTEDVSYLVNQVNDTTYNTNGINGPSIYATSGITFTDAATDLVNCNIAGGAVTYPTIYACFVHWCNTATGIANDFTYIDAPDTANYLFSSMKIKNTSATALTVTGGWGRDATSGLSADIVDTAGSTGNIFLAPDHVTPFSTGSGLTAGQDSKLTAIDSVCSQFNFNGTSVFADTKKINGTTVIGAGTSGNLWRA